MKSIDVSEKLRKIYILLPTSRDSNNGMGDLVAEVGLSGLLHLGQDHRGHFLRGLSRCQPGNVRV